MIPFAKPRAISQLVADNPHSVVITPTKSKQIPDTAVRKLDAATTVSPPVKRADQLARTGWTPPGGVKAIAPARPLAPATTAPITAFPASASSTSMAAQTMPLPMQQPLAAPATPVVEELQRDVNKPADPWAAYEQLGLGAPKLAPAVTFSQRFGKWIVSGYRLLGFAILTIIVIVLVGYIAQTAFFYMSDSWVVPSAVSVTDEKVVGLQAQLAEQQNTRDRLADELKQAERAIAAQQTFQGEFTKAIKNDLGGRKAALGRIRALANAAASTRASIKSQNSQYARASRRRMAEEYAAGLIDRSTMLSGKFQLAQISGANLSLAERQAEFETRAADLEAQTQSLEAIIEIDGETTAEEVALSYEVLRIKQEYESSKLDLAKSIEARDTLKAALERQDKIVASLKTSAYLRAINDGANVAFVPYANLANLAKGTPLYACKVGMILCYHVGEVLEVLPGEVQFKHPHRDKQLRGQIIELRLDPEDADAASDNVLFAGGKPLFL